MKRLGGILLTIAVVVGMKFFNKGQDHDEVKARLIEVCAGEQACVKSVEANFDACFEQSYNMGGRRRSAKLKSDELVKCLNGKSGEPYFQVAAKE